MLLDKSNVMDKMLHNVVFIEKHDLVTHDLSQLCMQRILKIDDKLYRVRVFLDYEDNIIGDIVIKEVDGVQVVVTRYREP